MTVTVADLSRAMSIERQEEQQAQANRFFDFAVTAQMPPSAVMMTPQTSAIVGGLLGESIFNYISVESEDRTYPWPNSAWEMGDGYDALIEAHYFKNGKETLIGTQEIVPNTPRKTLPSLPDNRIGLFATYSDGVNQFDGHTVRISYSKEEFKLLVSYMIANHPSQLRQFMENHRIPGWWTGAEALRELLAKKIIGHGQKLVSTDLIRSALFSTQFLTPDGQEISNAAMNIPTLADVELLRDRIKAHLKDSQNLTQQIPDLIPLIMDTDVNPKALQSLLNDIRFNFDGITIIPGEAKSHVVKALQKAAEATKISMIRWLEAKMHELTPIAALKAVVEVNPVSKSAENALAIAQYAVKTYHMEENDISKLTDIFLKKTDDFGKAVNEITFYTDDKKASKRSPHEVLALILVLQQRVKDGQYDRVAQIATAWNKVEGIWFSYLKTERNQSDKDAVNVQLRNVLPDVPAYGDFFIQALKEMEELANQVEYPVWVQSLIEKLLGVSQSNQKQREIFLRIINDEIEPNDLEGFLKTQAADILGTENRIRNLKYLATLWALAHPLKGFSKQRLDVNSVNRLVGFIDTGNGRVILGANNQSKKTNFEEVLREKVEKNETFRGVLLKLLKDYGYISTDGFAKPDFTELSSAFKQEVQLNPDRVARYSPDQFTKIEEILQNARDTDFNFEVIAEKLASEHLLTRLNRLSHDYFVSPDLSRLEEILTKWTPKLSDQQKVRIRLMMTEVPKGDVEVRVHHTVLGKESGASDLVLTDEEKLRAQLLQAILDKDILFRKIFADELQKSEAAGEKKPSGDVILENETYLQVPQPEDVTITRIGHEVENVRKIIIKEVSGAAVSPQDNGPHSVAILISTTHIREFFPIARLSFIGPRVKLEQILKALNEIVKGEIPSRDPEKFAQFLVSKAKELTVLFGMVNFSKIDDMDKLEAYFPGRITGQRVLITTNAEPGKTEKYIVQSITATELIVKKEGGDEILTLTNEALKNAKIADAAMKASPRAKAFFRQLAKIETMQGPGDEIYTLKGLKALGSGEPISIIGNGYYQEIPTSKYSWTAQVGSESFLIEALDFGKNNISVKVRLPISFYVHQGNKTNSPQMRQKLAKLNALVRTIVTCPNFNKGSKLTIAIIGSNKILVKLVDGIMDSQNLRNPAYGKDQNAYSLITRSKNTDSATVTTSYRSKAFFRQLNEIELIQGAGSDKFLLTGPKEASGAPTLSKGINYEGELASNYSWTAITSSWAGEALGFKVTASDFDTNNISVTINLPDPYVPWKMNKSNSKQMKNRLEILNALVKAILKCPNFNKGSKLTIVLPDKAKRLMVPIEQILNLQGLRELVSEQSEELPRVSGIRETDAATVTHAETRNANSATFTEGNLTNRGEFIKIIPGEVVVIRDSLNNEYIVSSSKDGKEGIVRSWKGNQIIGTANIEKPLPVEQKFVVYIFKDKVYVERTGEILYYEGEVDKAAVVNVGKVPVTAVRGGIDFNASRIGMTRLGSGMDIRFNQAMMTQLEHGDYDGLNAVITGITTIASIYPLLGMKEPEDNRKLARLS